MEIKVSVRGRINKFLSLLSKPTVSRASVLHVFVPSLNQMTVYQNLAELPDPVSTRGTRQKNIYFTCEFL